ncbi:peptidase M23 [Mycolicibacterium madagascariense]|uniref:Peptidase M23 n=1 Tax=Mycolicibacterium madagascariense TaxID=212765 RepID=A0A7I7XCS4_9MYCO|nr:M23 family metallopeptidase [Mycolicibacterium madagascariense]MCV7012939.1 M23 family metallopeptidase [Mycolicibacterium madagascariense]BBZ26188.1 peptidase M23 [Mycolicibacterium madagascariense]
MPRAVRTSLALLAAAVLTASCSAPAEKPSASSTSATPSQTPPLAPPAQVTPVLATVVAAPVPVPTTDGKRHLAYELQLTNTQAANVTLTSLSVRAAGRDLLVLAGARLAYWTRVLGASQTPTATLGPGQAGIVWLDVVLDASAPVPTELSHTIAVDLAAPMPPLLPAHMSEDGVAPVTVSTEQPAVISPPLDGPRWLDGDSCCDMTGHRMAMNPLDGSLWAAERFAVDYVQLSPNGTLFSGDRAAPQSYPYFGAAIHAVADGPVVAVLDGLPEQVAGRSPTGLPLDQYGGNHVVQDISGGGAEKRYAFYAHLQTGSVKVKPGDQLSTGQVIANLGNSGNTDAPHLHFHVMSTPDPLRSNGLPFVFKDFSLAGRLASMDALDAVMAGAPAPMAPGFAPRDESGVGPLVLDVMSYA